VNRETKRLMQRQGQMEADGSPSTRRAQVAWPSRAELINYTSVVFTTLVIMISLIFVLNLAFGKLITLLFSK